ncbi:hypothetical protein G7009_01655 [Pseudomonas capeferrum]|uniref:hypothetical protein n=1 Tax=Pseudomonas capeferrum TaxID=1495066 RepID=UPI0015E3E0F1|nr:hypothetical protein [Pseudomonas capeferrum]MBA1200507.1 hypothetical protein [Pseudomonas capeferrum]
MCQILYREGRQWALDSIRALRELSGKGDRYRQLVNYLERGTVGRPAAFCNGVNDVIAEVKRLGEAA